MTATALHLTFLAIALPTLMETLPLYGVGVRIEGAVRPQLTCLSDGYSIAGTPLSGVIVIQ